MITRRTMMATSVAFAAPMTFRLHAAAPSETLRHASFGAGGMALTDLKALSQHKHLKVVAICDVDTQRLGKCQALFPDAKAYTDWRVMLDQEKFDSANVGTPDHMHAAITMSILNRGLPVYCQKPLTRTLHESRRLNEVANAKKLVTQMGIQIHAHEAHRTTVKLVQSGVVGKIHAVHSWMGKGWGDPSPKPDREDTPPATLKWDDWLGVAAEHPFLGGEYYHPGNWRKRLDFGTGTLGDMGCHILDPIFSSLELTAPTRVVCTAGGIRHTNWGLDNRVVWTFPGTRHTAETLTLTWTDGAVKPDADILAKYGVEKPGSAGTLYVGEKGAVLSPYYTTPSLLPAEQFRDTKFEKVPGINHWFQFIDAVRGEGKCEADFAFAGPLTEAVLIGCLAERFLNQPLEWNAREMKVTNLKDANRFIRADYRKGWEIEGL